MASNSWRQPVAEPTAKIDVDSEITHSDLSITRLRGQVLSALQRLDAVEAVDREQGRLFAALRQESQMLQDDLSTLAHKVYGLRGSLV